MTRGMTIFDTALGPCGIAWGERGVVGVQLPEDTADATRARLCRRFPGARELSPPPSVQAAIGGMVALLNGERNDLSTVVLDLEATPEFNRRVYEVARTIPPGSCARGAPCPPVAAVLARRPHVVEDPELRVFNQEIHRLRLVG